MKKFENVFFSFLLRFIHKFIRESFWQIIVANFAVQIFLSIMHAVDQSCCWRQRRGNFCTLLTFWPVIISIIRIWLKPDDCRAHSCLYFYRSIEQYIKRILCWFIGDERQHLRQCSGISSTTVLWWRKWAEQLRLRYFRRFYTVLSFFLFYIFCSSSFFSSLSSVRHFNNHMTDVE